MNFRTTDTSSASISAGRINAQRSRLSILQEQIASGKRINRPSDDPSGAEAVIKLKTSQREIEQFKRSATTANQKLTAADDGLSGYENILERVRTLLAQGMSDTASQTAKNSLATEIESLRSRVLNVANSKYGDEYLFGGTRQSAPPFDPSTAAPAAAPTSPQFVQIEPGVNAIAVGVTADTIFSDSTSDIFTDLNNAVAALRGTGNPAADRATLETTMTRVATYSDLVNVAHAKVGANMNAADYALDNLTNNFLSLDERVNEIENADFAETALKFAEAQQTLDATLQMTAQNRRNLFDFLG